MSPKLLNILLIICSVVLYIGYLKPMYTGAPGVIWTPEKSLSALKNENVQYANAINQIELIRREAEKINKEYEAIDKEVVTKAELFLPKVIDPLKLRNDVISIASKSGIAISGLTVTHDATNSFYKVSFAMKTRYSLFKNFIQNYEKSTRVFSLSVLTIARIDDGENKNLTLSEMEDNEGKLNIRVESRVYYKK